MQLRRDDGTTLTPEEAAELVRADLPAPQGRPAVLLNMVTTLDGRAAVDGRSGPIGGDADQALFGALRTLPDVVLAGTGTVAAEGYGRIAATEERRAARRAAGLDEVPAVALVSRSGTFPWDASLFAAEGARVHLHADAPVDVPPGTRADVTVHAGAAPDAVLRTLADVAGAACVLCEGGPQLNGALLAARVVDELFLTLGPLVTADPGEPGIVSAREALAEPARFALRWALRHEDELLLRYRAR